MPSSSFRSSFRPRKRFGQNFLIDTFVIQNIIEAIHPELYDHLIEIGPGLGAITNPLLQRVSKLEVIEFDRDLAKKLKEKKEAIEGKLVVHEGDALKFDFISLIKNDLKIFETSNIDLKNTFSKASSKEGSKLRIVGNLPYNISTPLIFHLLKFEECIQDMHFMLQKEVVDRMVALPGNKDYGRLSVMVQYACEVKSLFIVEPESFKPRPKVRSAFVRLVPHQKKLKTESGTETETGIAKNILRLQEITTKAFSQRRKTIQNALKSFLTAEDFQVLKIDPQLRPEDLSVEDYVTISNYINYK